MHDHYTCSVTCLRDFSKTSYVFVVNNQSNKVTALHCNLGKLFFSCKFFHYYNYGSSYNKTVLISTFHRQKTAYLKSKILG